jgi:hypothetical protein
MSQTIVEPAKLTPEEVAAIHRAADASRQLAMTIGRPVQAALTPMQAGRAGEPTVMMLINKPLLLTLDKATKVRFEIGLQSVPFSLADHWFVKAHRFNRYGPGPAVGAEPERDPELPPRVGASMDESVARQLQEQGDRLTDAQQALAAKDARLAELEALLAAKPDAAAQAATADAAKAAATKKA